MNIPQFGQPQNPDPYTIPQLGSENKKKTILMFGGIAVLILLLVMVLFSGGAPAGKEDTLTAATKTGEAIGLISAYSPELKSTTTQNDIALIKVILTGNYQSLSTLYKGTFDKKKVLSSSPKPSTASVEAMQAAVKNDTVDEVLIDELQPTIVAAQRALISMKPSFKKPADVQTINTAQIDFQSISDILDKQQ